MLKGESNKETSTADWAAIMFVSDSDYNVSYLGRQYSVKLLTSLNKISVP